MTIDEATGYLAFMCTFDKSEKERQAIEMAISALQAQQEAEKQCDQCDGILYRQTSSGKIVPCDKICAGKFQQ